VSSLPKNVTRQRRDCDLNPGPSALESSMLTTRLPRRRDTVKYRQIVYDVPLTVSSYDRTDDGAVLRSGTVGGTNLNK